MKHSQNIVGGNHHRELQPIAVEALLKQLGEKNQSIDVRIDDDEKFADKSASGKESFLIHPTNKVLFDPMKAQSTLDPGRFVYMGNDEYCATDDTTRLVCHEEFKRFIFLAMQVKNFQDAMNRGSTATPTELAESLDHLEAHQLIDRMINAQSPHRVEESKIIRRGVHPNIDELLDKMTNSLIIHYRYLEEEFHRNEENFSGDVTSTRKRKAASKSIANKYTKDRTDYLYEWMDDNAHHPYPNTEEIEFLAMGSGLLVDQVNNWATNVRKRKVKAMADQSKKPTDYLDFRFLAEHRDKEFRNGSSEKSGRPTCKISGGSPYSGVIQGNHSTVCAGVIPDFAPSIVLPAQSKPGGNLRSNITQNYRQGSFALVTPAPEKVYSNVVFQASRSVPQPAFPCMTLSIGEEFAEEAKMELASNLANHSMHNSDLDGGGMLPLFDDDTFEPLAFFTNRWSHINKQVDEPTALKSMAVQHHDFAWSQGEDESKPEEDAQSYSTHGRFDLASTAIEFRIPDTEEHGDLMYNFSLEQV